MSTFTEDGVERIVGTAGTQIQVDTSASLVMPITHADVANLQPVQMRDMARFVWSNIMDPRHMLWQQVLSLQPLTAIVARGLVKAAFDNEDDEDTQGCAIDLYILTTVLTRRVIHRVVSTEQLIFGADIQSEFSDKVTLENPHYTRVDILKNFRSQAEVVKSDLFMQTSSSSDSADIYFWTSVLDMIDQLAKERGRCWLLNCRQAVRKERAERDPIGYMDEINEVAHLSQGVNLISGGTLSSERIKFLKAFFYNT